MKKLLFFLFGLIVLLAGCATVQYTNRTSFMLITPEEEIALGEEAYNQVLAEAKLSQDLEMVSSVEKVGKRIAAVADKPEYNWEFSLIDDPDSVNAFALPGGKVAFYSGILPICKDELGIAVVMGHEVAHVIARHGAERMSQGMLAEFVGGVLQVAITNKTPEAQNAILNGYGLATTVGVMLPFSRKHESEADYIGLLLMAEAGYDPFAAIEFWERMQALSGGEKVPEMLSTHPHDAQRITALKQNLPEAMEHYEASRM
jgi:predicted Zn-dependent protease